MLGALDRKAVVCEFDIVGQKPRIARMQNVVIKMRQISTLRLKLFNDRKGFLEMQMRRMRLDPDAIQHQNLQIAKSIHGILRNRFQVGGIGKIIESIGYHG